MNECKYNFHTCSNNTKTMCNPCIDGDNYEFLQGSKSIKDTYSTKEVIKLIKLHSEHIYQGYYVFKKPLEDVLDYDKEWIEKTINKKQ